MIQVLLQLFKPAAHIDQLSQQHLDQTYKRLRLQVFFGIFIGYAGYYLVRKNFALAMPYLHQQGYDNASLGLILSAVSIAYGLSKFLMGNVSDRSNSRYFLAAGLVLSAVINIFFGAYHGVTQSVTFMFILMFLNGWVQGMGWPPCGRTMVHWYSVNERGRWVSVWNVAHNVGGGMIGPLAILGISLFATWKSIFYFPAAVALFVAAFIIVTMRDTPQSCGLPPIEDYRDDHPENALQNPEAELSARDIFIKYVFSNKYLWLLAVANIFVYLVRYGVIDWVPTYLQVVKGFSADKSSWAYALYEFAGIPGTILCGFLSDTYFKGRRAPIGVLYLGIVTVAVMIYWLYPGHNIMVYNAVLITIGFLIYGPVMLIGLQALDMVPKKAAGTAAGLTGLFGYLGGAVLADAGLGRVLKWYGWNGGFIVLLAACLLAMLFLSLTWHAGTTSAPMRKSDVDDDLLVSETAAS